MDCKHLFHTCVEHLDWLRIIHVHLHSNSCYLFNWKTPTKVIRTVNLSRYVIQLIYIIIFVQPTKTAIKGNFFFKFMDFVCLLFSCYCSLTALGTLVSCSFSSDILCLCMVPSSLKLMLSNVVRTDIWFSKC